MSIPFSIRLAVSAVSLVMRAARHAPKVLHLFCTDPSMLAHMNGQVHEGKYTYLSHLLAFQNLHPIQACSCKEIITPLKLYEWGQLLSTHPDKEFVRYILQGIQDGFRIGYDTRVSARHNLPPRNPAAITEYFQNELRLGRITKCPRGEWHREIHVSPIGIIPKKNKPGKWRLIVDLSSPDGASVNDGISSQSGRQYRIHQ